MVGRSPILRKRRMSKTDPTAPSAPNPLALCATASLIGACIGIATAATVLVSLSPKVRMTPEDPTRRAKPGQFVPLMVLGGLLLALAFPLAGFPLAPRSDYWKLAGALAAGSSGVLSALLWARAVRLPKEKDGNAAAAGFSGATVLFGLTGATVPPSIPAWWTVVWYGLGLAAIVLTVAQVWWPTPQSACSSETLS